MLDTQTRSMETITGEKISSTVRGIPSWDGLLSQSAVSRPILISGIDLNHLGSRSYLADQIERFSILRYDSVRSYYTSTLLSKLDLTERDVLVSPDLRRA